MYYSTRILRNENGTLRWYRINEQGCHDNWNDNDPNDPFGEEYPAVLVICDGGQPRDEEREERKLRITYIAEGGLNDEDRVYDHIMWDWLNHPFVYFNVETIENLLSEDTQPEDYAMLINRLNDIGQIVALPTIAIELQTVVDHIREETQNRIAPSFPPATRWRANEQINGGELYHVKWSIFIARFDILPAINLLSPVDDTERRRFHTFNQGPMEIPEANFTLLRIHTGLSEVNDDNAYIDYNNSGLYIVLDSDTVIRQGDVMSIHSEAEDHEPTLLIAYITNMVRIHNEIIELTFDRQWQSFHFAGGVELIIGFSERDRE